MKTLKFGLAPKYIIKSSVRAVAHIVLDAPTSICGTLVISVWTEYVDDEPPNDLAGMRVCRRCIRATRKFKGGELEWLVYSVDKMVANTRSA